MAYITVDVDVDLDSFTDEELIEEIRARNIDYYDITLLERIRQRRILGKDYQKELDELIFISLGRF